MRGGGENCWMDGRPPVSAAVVLAVWNSENWRNIHQVNVFEPITVGSFSRSILCADKRGVAHVKWFVCMHHHMESPPFCPTQILSASPQYETLTQILKLSVSCQRRLERHKRSNCNHHFVSWWISCPFSLFSFSSPFSFLFDVLICILLSSPSVSAVCQCQTQGQSQRECCPVLDGANSIMRSSLFCISLCCLYYFLCLFSSYSTGVFLFCSMWKCRKLKIWG